MAGYVKLFRSIESWEWYTDVNTKTVFLHCLLRANFVAKKWKGIEIEKGQFVTSTLKLAEELHLSRQVVRTSLERLKSTNEITIKSTNKYIVINVVKWADYQSNEDDINQLGNQQSNFQLTNNQPSNNQQITTTKNDKNIKNNKNEENKEITYDAEAREADTTYAGLSIEDAYKIICQKPFSEDLTDEEVRIVKIHDRLGREGWQRIG